MLTEREMDIMIVEAELDMIELLDMFEKNYFGERRNARSGTEAQAETETAATADATNY